ncbi:hypothetical protein LCI24_04315 [Tenacibaculum sp. LAR 2:5]|uniref:Peptidase M43 pregnancy-associated plasma-A domain-containing protein n=1 Tax=Tenacibaculum larymnensis TaxID=2878201 RepID=A0A9X4EMY3_9FLAO|nr:hypothetical protein [Tenacibaculum larymnensis]
MYICNLNTGASTPTGVSLVKNRYDNGVSIGYSKVTKTGRTIIHEVGHWLSLLHAFEGGFRNKDGVEDTPAQKKSFKCYETRIIECKNSIMHTNFMGYSSCRYFLLKDRLIE